MGRSTKGSSFRVAAKGVVAAQSLRRLWCLQKRWAFVTDADLQDSGEWVRITEATPKIRPFWSIEKIREDWDQKWSTCFFTLPHCRRYQWKSLSRLTWICSSLRRRGGLFLGVLRKTWSEIPRCMKWDEMTQTWCDDDMEISGKKTQKTHEKTHADPCPAYSKTFNHLQILFHKTFGCQAQWMPETSHSQWRNRTSCLPWNYQGSAAEVGTMCDINWITWRSFCISNKWLDVVNMFLKAGMQPRTFRSFVLRFYDSTWFLFVDSTRTQRLDIAKEWIWLWRAELHESYIELHWSLPVARLGQVSYWGSTLRSCSSKSGWGMVGIVGLVVKE